MAEPADVPGGFGAQPRTQSYRPDIDGLRAVAVVPVVLFHSGLQQFSGGFVGVDVFFVISGYLITQILYREAQAGRFSIARFYARRIRRIFPALFLMLGATLAAGAWLLLPDELAALSKSAIATAVFASNVLFYTETGYFEVGALYKPLLHTWSLALEEQFYIFFPIGLWVLHRYFRPNLLPLLVAATALSFALNLLLVETAPAATFYMLPTRAWELLAGAIIAIAPPRLPGAARQLAAAAGLAAIVAAVLLFDEAMPFPGAAALLPVAGSAMVIAAAEGTATGRLLALPAVRGIGLISYSLYLWHWPVLTFARFALGTELDPQATLACVVFSVLMAWLSWRFVEAPFRKSGPPKPAIVGGLATMAAGIAVAALLLPGLPGRMPREAVAMASAGRPPRHVPPCFVEQGPNPELEKCVGGEVVLIGDSHALQFYAPARRLVGEIGFLGRGGCLPVAGLHFSRFGRVDPHCAEFNSDAFARFITEPSIRTVVLAGRWARLTFPNVDPEAQRAHGDLGRALSRTVAMLRAAGKRVVLIGPVPEFKEPLPACLARAIWRNLGSEVCQHNPLTVGNREVEQWLAGAGADAVILPTRALCRNGKCATMLDGRPISWDRDHLTADAAALVLERSRFAEAAKGRGDPG